MANLISRIFRKAPEQRARIGKFDSQTIAQEMGINFRQHVTVSEGEAFGLSTVYACIYRIASTCASLSLNIYQRDGRNVTLAEGHPAFDLVRYQPNEYQTAYEFWELLYTQALMYGVGYAQIERDAAANPIGLHVRHYYDVDPKNVNGELIYYVRNVGPVRPENMLELPNLGRKSPIRVHADNLGLAKAVQDYGADYFANGAKPSGILTAKNPMKKEQVDVVLESWRSQGGGVKFIPYDLGYNSMNIPPDEAQFVETRKFQSEEICRIYSVPPDLVQLPGKSTFNNVEQQHIQFARHTITPWAIRLSQEVDRKLIQRFQRPLIYSRHDMTDLYRGDMAARSNFYQQMLTTGVMSINEVRAKEDMNPVEGGDLHTVQVNQIALSNFEQYSNKISSDDERLE
jgi:HK97 family phage portal protein